MGRPRTGETPVRSVRLGAVWEEAEANAKADGENMATLLDRLLRRYNTAARRRRLEQPEAETRP